MSSFPQTSQSGNNTDHNSNLNGQETTNDEPPPAFDYDDQGNMVNDDVKILKVHCQGILIVAADLYELLRCMPDDATTISTKAQELYKRCQDEEKWLSHQHQWIAEQVRDSYPPVPGVELEQDGSTREQSMYQLACAAMDSVHGAQAAYETKVREVTSRAAYATLSPLPSAVPTPPGTFPQGTTNTINAPPLQPLFSQSMRDQNNQFTTLQCHWKPSPATQELRPQPLQRNGGEGSSSVSRGQEANSDGESDTYVPRTTPSAKALGKRRAEPVDEDINVHPNTQHAPHALSEPSVTADRLPLSTPNLGLPDEDVDETDLLAYSAAAIKMAERLKELLENMPNGEIAMSEEIQELQKKCSRASDFIYSRSGESKCDVLLRAYDVLVRAFDLLSDARAAYDAKQDEVNEELELQRVLEMSKTDTRMDAREKMALYAADNGNMGSSSSRVPMASSSRVPMASSSSVPMASSSSVPMTSSSVPMTEPLISLSEEITSTVKATTPTQSNSVSTAPAIWPTTVNWPAMQPNIAGQALPSPPLRQSTMADPRPHPSPIVPSNRNNSAPAASEGLAPQPPRTNGGDSSSTVSSGQNPATFTLPTSISCPPLQPKIAVKPLTSLPEGILTVNARHPYPSLNFSSNTSPIASAAVVEGPASQPPQRNGGQGSSGVSRGQEANSDGESDTYIPRTTPSAKALGKRRAVDEDINLHPTAMPNIPSSPKPSLNPMVSAPHPSPPVRSMETPYYVSPNTSRDNEITTPISPRMPSLPNAAYRMPPQPLPSSPLRQSTMTETGAPPTTPSAKALGKRRAHPVDEGHNLPERAPNSMSSMVTVPLSPPPVRSMETPSQSSPKLKKKCKPRQFLQAAFSGCHTESPFVNNLDRDQDPRVNNLASDRNARADQGQSQFEDIDWSSEQPHNHYNLMLALEAECNVARDNVSKLDKALRDIPHGARTMSTEAQTLQIQCSSDLNSLYRWVEWATQQDTRRQPMAKVCRDREEVVKLLTRALAKYAVKEKKVANYRAKYEEYVDQLPESSRTNSTRRPQKVDRREDTSKPLPPLPEEREDIPNNWTNAQPNSPYAEWSRPDNLLGLLIAASELVEAAPEPPRRNRWKSLLPKKGKGWRSLWPLFKNRSTL